MEFCDCVLYGITPPKQGHTEERFNEIKNIQLERINGIQPDALIIYDIQDESSRITESRPFPFVDTVCPEEYANDLLKTSSIAPVIYKSIGQFSKTEFNVWLNNLNAKHLVLVGAPSSKNKLDLNLGEAYQTVKTVRSDLKLGGIVIPERHLKKGDEHMRVISKMEAGCSFFISQCVFSIENTLNFLADYKWSCKQRGIEMATILFTLTPCASDQTIQFMKWLGVNVPSWIQHQLLESEDMLKSSLDLCVRLAEELIVFCGLNQIPFGFNIESVSIRKKEIDASIELYHTVNKLMSTSILIKKKQKDSVVA